MNNIRKHTKQKATTSKEKRVAKGLQKFLGLSGFYVSGNNMLTIGLIAVLILLYILNSYNTERKTILINELTKENNVLRAEYILSKSKVTYAGSQSNLARRLSDCGIKEASVPPEKIIKTGASK